MSNIDKVEIDQDLRGVKVKLRRSRTFRNPRLFADWTQALIHTIKELQLEDEVHGALSPAAPVAVTTETPQVEAEVESVKE